MKTTDSVMREEIIEFFSHHPTKQSARNFLTRRLSHSLAEARREWVEEIKKKISQCKQAPGMSCEYCSALYDVLSILNPLSEHDLELIREGRAMSDFDTRRGE